MADNLIIYFSRKGQNYFGGRIRSVPKGNTAYVAEYIQKAVGGDLFEIETVETYPEDYMECTEVAKREKNADARPELKRYLESAEGYDNVFVCGPCWWGTYPMAVFSQLDRLDLSGKRVFPVMTHEGSGLGSSESDLRRHCRGARVEAGLAVPGSSAEGSERRVSDWARKAVERSFRVG